MNKRILAGTVLIILLVSGIWYFFLKEYDYSVHFNTEAAPGIVYQRILDWEYEQLKHRGNETSPFREIVQKIQLNQRSLLLIWKFSPINDSLTRIEASVKNTKDPFNQRWNRLLGKNSQQEIIKGEVERIKNNLEADREFYDITINGEATSPKTTCACIRLENEVGNKAFDMMQNINYLSSYVNLNNLEMAGKPRVQVIEWDLATDYIKFDFCFPIQAPSALPEEHISIFIKDMESQKALKATYNGNYMFSHLAWIQLLHYAEIHNIPVEKTPLEIFQDNPEMGGDGRQWTTEIYLPVK